ncbi:MAG: HEAT repeat domain-containing protein [Calditrichaeota bacterium]|nr:MAG: HEAT repeat domain-containing protein [Calditrichota bacterium]
MQETDLELKLYEALNHTDVEERRRAILKLGEKEDPQVLKILAGFFFDPHPAIRDAIFQVFTSRPSRQRAEIAADTLLAPQLSVRSLAIDILRQLGEEAVWPLKRLAKSTQPDVRKIVAEILGGIPHPMAREVLLQLMKDEEENVVFAAIESLGNLYEVRALPEAVQRLQSGENLRAAVIDALLKIFSYWEQRLVPEIDSRQSFDFGHLAFLLGIQKCGNAFALDVILALIANSPELPIQIEAVKGLASILKNNPNIHLNPDLFPTIQRLYQLNSGALPRRELLTVLSRIPSTESLQLLLVEMERAGHRGEAAVSFFQFCRNYLGLFLQHFLSLSPPIRQKVLKDLESRGLGYEGKALFALLEQVTLLEEKLALFRLAARAKSERFLPHLEKAYYDANISREAFYALAFQMQHPRLINYYIEGLFHKKQNIAHTCRRILVQFGQRSLTAMLDYCTSAPASRWEKVAWAVGAFPLEQALFFWKQFFQSGLLQRRRFARRLIQQNPHWEHTVLILLALQDRPEDLEYLQEFMRRKNLQPAITPAIQEFLQTQAPSVRRKLNFLLKSTQEPFDTVNGAAKKSRQGSYLLDLLSKEVGS